MEHFIYEARTVDWKDWEALLLWEIDHSITIMAKLGGAHKLVINHWKGDWFINLHKQHTPNPDAHDPEAVPPKLEQSEVL